MNKLLNKELIENEDEFYLIVTTPGVFSSKEMNFSYHAKNTGSKFYYYKKTNLSVIEVSPIEQKWSTKGQENVKTDDAFYQERYLCQLSLLQLEPDTEYCYFIANQKYKSRVHSFHTSKEEGDFEFMALVDVQHPFNENTSLLIKQINSLSNDIHLIACSGDLTGCSAIEAQYRWLLDKNFDNTIFACAPGDHEYWANNNGSPYPMFQTPYTFNAVFNNPKNGPIESLNSCFYFYDNGVLFIVIDMLDSNTTQSSKLDSEAKWFDETLTSLKGTYRYSVLLAHKSLYGSEIEDKNVRKILAPVWHQLVDKHHIDLVIGGHDHMYSRTYPLRNGKVTSDCYSGTYYLDLGSSGNKYRVSSEDLYLDNLHEKVLNLKDLSYALGARVRVKKDVMNVTVLNMNGLVVDQFDIFCKK